MSHPTDSRLSHRNSFDSVPVFPDEKEAPQKSSPEKFPVSFLERMPLFRDLTGGQIVQVQNITTRRELAVDEVLLSEDQPGDSVFLLVEGSIKVTVRKGEGVVVLGLGGRGEIIGEISVLDGRPRSATVAAQTSCVIGVIPHTQFWSVLWEMPPIPYNVACLLAERVRRLTAKVQAMATLDVRGRLAFQLVTLAQEHAIVDVKGTHEIPFHLTQAELAQMVGTSRVQVNQLITAWKRHDFLSTKRGALRIHNLDAFCAMFPPALFTRPIQAARPYAMLSGE